MALIQISMGDLKIHHLGTGAVLSIVSYIATYIGVTQYGLSIESIPWINLISLIIPITFGIHHKKCGNKIRHSTGICLISGHGIFFTIILNYFQTGILPIIFENLNNIR